LVWHSAAVSSIQPVTFYVPSTADEPIEVNVSHSGLRMVLVNRDAIRLLSSDWRVLGVYFLLGPDPESSERYLAYIGEVGRRNLFLRLTEHATHKDWWNRALLVASNSADGFNSAEIGWLEGRFYDVLNNAVAATLMNRGRPGDDSIAVKDRGVLERYVEPTLAALRAVGASPDTADQKPAPGGKKRAYYHESVKDLIDADLLKPGTRLRPLRKHLTKTALVLEDGSLEVDGSRFAAVSPAAQAISGNLSEPGWEFWGAPSGDGGLVSLFALRDRLRADLAGTGQSGETVTVRRDAPALQTSRTSPEASTDQAPRRPKRYEATLRDLLDAGLLTTGEALIPPPRGKSRSAKVTQSGTIQVDNVEYVTPSGAAKASSGNSAEPGWEYWSVDRSGVRTTLFELRSRLRSSRSR
jgi:hypothetical protein